MRRVSRRAKVTVAAVVVITTLAAGGAAWAFWQITGNGNASARAGAPIELEVSGRTYPTAPIFPGATTDVEVTVVNKNAFPVLVTQVRPGSAPATVDSPHVAAGCITSGVSAASTTYSVAWSVPKKSTESFLLPSGIKMTNASDSACQGATFTVSFVVSGRSAT
jgi:hypothetical protein